MTGETERQRRGFASFQDLGWRTGLFRTLLIVVLAASLTAAPVAILHALMPWRLNYVLPLALLVALMGVFNTVRLGRPDWRDRRGLAFRLGELIVLLAVTQVSIWAFSAGWPAKTAIVTWLRHPGTFISGQFLVIGALQLCIWGLAVAITGDFLALAIQPDEVAAHESHEWGDTQSQWRVFRPISRGEIVGRFAQRWIWSGTALITLAALSRLTVATDTRGILKFGLGRTGLPPDVLAGLLGYFLAGLLLLSDARLAVLRGRWYNERVEIAPRVTRRWHLSSVLMLLLVAGAALLLPLGSAGWLGQAVEWLIALVMRFGLALLLLLSLLLAFLAYLARLLFGAPEDLPLERPVLPALDLPTQIEAARRLPDWLGGAVLWIVVGLVAGYLLLTYLRASGRLAWVGAPWVMRLRLWWRARRARLDTAVQARVKAWRARWRAGRRQGAARPATRPVRLNELLPRERVRYLYVQALGRAAERGLARPPHRTPLEFARDLETHLPEAEDDVQALTEAFVDARYSPREIPVAEAQSAQSAWQRLMAVLRKPIVRKPDGKQR